MLIRHPRGSEGDMSLLKGPRFQAGKRFHAHDNHQAQDQRDRSSSVNLDGEACPTWRPASAFRPYVDLWPACVDLSVSGGISHRPPSHQDVGMRSARQWQALGTMAGITRYASIYMPMDETLSRVVIDISGRPVLVFKVEFPRDKVGTFDTELVREWFNAFAINAGVTLHVETLYGENSHHIAESCFKGLARALRAAVAIDPRAAGEVPSTKGQLGG
jgi:imidazoleglycerol-phosphate dehydratase